MMCDVIMGLILAAIVCLVVILGVYKYTRRVRVTLKGKHVVVTGGSSGIGKSLAREAAKRGAHVTIVARNVHRLKKAAEEITMACATKQTQQIQTVSLDISNNYEEIKEKLLATEELAGPVFMLVNCAGTALCGVLEDATEEQIKSQFNINTIGSILSTKAVLSGMKSRRQGHIVLVASQAAYCGIYGFTAYSASKFALRGFAEALNMEVAPFNIKVTVSYPPDTDTPGFREEELTKPKETKLISASSGLFMPDEVAVKILKDSLAGRFSSNIGMDGFMLEHLCCGMSPMDSLFDLVVQFLMMNCLRTIGVAYSVHFKNIVTKCYFESIRKKNEASKQE